MEDERRKHKYKVVRDKNGVTVDGVSAYQLKMKTLRQVCAQLGVPLRGQYNMTRGYLIDSIYRRA